MNKVSRNLVFTDFFLPGHRAGGPIQSIANLIENLGDEFEFFVVTRDRDSGADQPYSEVDIDEWNRMGKGQVYYASPGPDFAMRVAEVWNDLQPDAVYLNSFFSPKFTILPLVLRRLGVVPDCPVVVAPRGEFHRGARNIKAFKKGSYRVIARFLNLYRGVRWCATSPEEADFIREILGTDAPIRVAPNLGRRRLPSRAPDARPKQAGAAKFVVVARVAPIKNLHRSLMWLHQLEGDVVFDIFGPISNDDYWEKCRREMKKTPENITADYRGPIPHEQVHDTIGNYDFFLMPSESENHGHAIVEAMMAGCPPIISAGTPWRGLEERGVGWDISLEDDDKFVRTLQRCIDMGPDEHASFSENAHEYAAEQACPAEALEQNRRLFIDAVQ